jgi:peptidoglycan/LPS O-acetylase OafA/YrhL
MMGRRNPGWEQFDTARLLLAAMVALAHAYYIFLTPIGHSGLLLTVQWLAWLAVLCFFVLSGLVIGRSLQRRYDGFIPFMMRRIWRIYPPLLICFALMIAIAAGLRWNVIPTGPVAAAFPMVESFNFDLHRALLCLGTFGFRGWLSSGANGSLWSLAVEMRCYVIVGLVGQALQTKSRMVQALCVAALFYLGNFLIHDRTDYQITLCYAAFAVGALLSLWLENPKQFLPGVPLDISYGLYIFHFPIMLAFFLVFYQPSFPGNVIAVALAISAIGLAIVLATCSAKWIERFRPSSMIRLLNPIDFYRSAGDVAAVE